MNIPAQNFLPAPTIYETTPHGGMRAWTIESKLLEEEKTIFLTGQFNDGMADQLVKQLMYLGGLMSKANGSAEGEIAIYLNSPGGVITSGMAVYDTMQMLEKRGIKIRVVAMGMAASMGSFILMAGTKGYRAAMRNAEIMIHQPSGGAQGQATDILIQAKHIERTKQKMNALYAKHCGGAPEEWDARMNRDNYLTVDEALALGLIDEIIG